MNAKQRRKRRRLPPGIEALHTMGLEDAIIELSKKKSMPLLWRVLIASLTTYFALLVTVAVQEMSL